MNPCNKNNFSDNTITASQGTIFNLRNLKTTIHAILLLMVVLISGDTEAQKSQVQQKVKRPNILFILTDDLGMVMWAFFFKIKERRITTEVNPRPLHLTSIILLQQEPCFRSIIVQRLFVRRPGLLFYWV